MAQARTLTTLSELDANRKGALIQFLYESDTIGSAYIDRNYQNVIVQAIISLEGADMSGANLFHANISGANLDFVNLSKANFSFAGWFSPSLNSFIPSGFDGGLTSVSLFNANLDGANLYAADMDNANLSSANLNNANLAHALLRGADLSGTTLDGAIFIGADLTSADLSYANLKGAILDPNQLLHVKSLKGATMPDGSEHP